jgi:leader peptidase (prepilin peptidase) / N-methyltransferase
MACLVVAFIFGAFAGSFLNVCIHRLPRNESVVSPPSRCYACGTRVAWYDNLPILSYLILHGRCRWCGTGFSARYLGIEALVGLLTAGGAWFALLSPLDPRAPWTMGVAMPDGVARILAAIAILALVYVLVVSVFTDLEHMIIPDELTKSFQVLAPFVAAFAGTNLAIGWTCASWLTRPTAMDGAQIRVEHFLGWFEGTVGVSLVVLLVSLPAARWIYTRFCPGPMRWSDEDHRGFRLGVLWFAGSLVLPAAMVAILALHGQDWSLLAALGLAQAVLGALAGWMSLYLVGLAGTVAFRRNAMGFGDVKFLAPIGCFLGPVGVLYAFFTATIIGTAVGVPMRLASARREIPFGPYLAIGALIVLVGGRDLHAWVLQTLRIGL